MLLHALESHTTGPNARIVFTWNEQNRIAIPTHLYPEFNIGLEFGHAYFNYAQVGRQLHEVFYAADTLLWFGESFTEKRRNSLKIKMEKWFSENRALINWNDPKLAIGQVTVVARLAEIPASADEN